MEEERDKAWNRFTSTGRVSDYLAYVADRESYRYGDCGSKEEKIVETAGNGHGTVGHYHRGIRLKGCPSDKRMGAYFGICQRGKTTEKPPFGVYGTFYIR